MILFSLFCFRWRIWVEPQKFIHRICNNKCAAATYYFGECGLWILDNFGFWFPLFQGRSVDLFSFMGVQTSFVAACFFSCHRLRLRSNCFAWLLAIFFPVIDEVWHLHWARWCCGWGAWLRDSCCSPIPGKEKQDATWRGLWTSPFGLPMVSGRLVFRQPCASLSRSFRVFPRSVWGILLLESSLVIRLQDFLLLSVSFRTHLWHAGVFTKLVIHILGDITCWATTLAAFCLSRLAWKPLSLFVLDTKMYAQHVHTCMNYLWYISIKFSLSPNLSPRSRILSPLQVNTTSKS